VEEAGGIVGRDADQDLLDEVVRQRRRRQHAAALRARIVTQPAAG
jgi:hypothetical protein